MPYIQSKNHVLNASDQEAKFLDELAKNVNNRYSPAKLNLTSKDLVNFYYENEEFYINEIKKFLSYYPSLKFPLYYKKLEESIGESLTKFLSIDNNGNYTLINTHNTMFNILFAYAMIDLPAFTHLAKKYLKDTSVFTPIKKVIKDDKILSFIYPNGYEKVTVYDFLKQYSFHWDYYSLLSYEGIGKARLEKIKNSLSDFGYPLIIGNMRNFHRGFSLRLLERILLSTTKDLENAGFNSDIIDFLKTTKYINNVKTVEDKIESTKTTAPAIINSMAKQVAENITERKPTIETKKEKEKSPQKETNVNKPNAKYLDLISKMPNSIIKKMIVNEFKSNLNLLLNLGKQEPQLLLDYAECIPFKKYRSLDNLSQVLTVITIQPKLIRKLEPRMVVLLMTSQPAPMHKIIYSDKMTKAEAVSLNAYVNKIVSERLTKKGVTKNR